MEGATEPAVGNSIGQLRHGGFVLQFYLFYCFMVILFHDLLVVSLPDLLKMGGYINL